MFEHNLPPQIKILKQKYLFKQKTENSKLRFMNLKKLNLSYSVVFKFSH